MSHTVVLLTSITLVRCKLLFYFYFLDPHASHWLYPFVRYTPSPSINLPTCCRTTRMVLSQLTIMLSFHHPQLYPAFTEPSPFFNSSPSAQLDIYRLIYTSIHIGMRIRGWTGAV